MMRKKGAMHGEMTRMIDPTMGADARSGRAWDVVRVASGNFIEMFDFMVFGYFAAAIGAAYFPGSSELGTLLKALATFGVGLLMLPLVPLLPRAYTDRHGRRAGLMLTLALMGVGIVTIAFTPGYVAI